MYKLEDLVDLSDSDIKNLAKRLAWDNVTTRYLPIIGISLAVLTLILMSYLGFWVVIALYSISGFLVVTGIGNFAVKLFLLNDKMIDKLLDMRLIAFEKLTQAQIATLETKLMASGELHAAKQLNQMTETFNRFKKKLKDKLGTKRGYSQYLSAAEDARSAALHNLNQVLDNEEDIRMLDVDDSKSRIAELERQVGVDNTQEIADHQKQIDLAQGIEEGNRQLIAEVESAIATLKGITVDLSNIKLGADLEKDIGSAVDRLSMVADRNKRIYTKVSKTLQELRL